MPGGNPTFLNSSEERRNPSVPQSDEGHTRNSVIFVIYLALSLYSTMADGIFDTFFRLGLFEIKKKKLRFVPCIYYIFLDIF